ncbi:Hypothetical predicted protein [Olea europaea subsp. europaea]|uniref:Uncharacterized protein n=1 Tax=Olea europaea subsp. europaea TaxID=158383 RepID=A0A8S0PMI6_OLEEU|nr:Hypothetical predicted protein [Olea europaea subsp. europaea]
MRPNSIAQFPNQIGLSFVYSIFHFFAPNRFHTSISFKPTTNPYLITERRTQLAWCLAKEWKVELHKTTTNSYGLRYLIAVAGETRGRRRAVYSAFLGGVQLSVPVAGWIVGVGLG